MIIIPGTSIRLGGDGRLIFRDRVWNSRDGHVHIGSGSERRTKYGRVVRYLEGEGSQVKGVAAIKVEDKNKGFPW